MSPSPSAVPCPSYELAPGYSIARLITGCWQLATDHGAARAGTDELMTRWARDVDLGYTTFDCADIYTGVEELLGRFLADLPDPERVQVHTKYVPDAASLGRLTRRDVERSIDRSRARLGRDTLDLVQFHWWDSAVPGCIETAGWLEDLKRAGKIRHLGLTNFDVDHVREIVEAGIGVTSVQVQYSVLDRRPEHGLARWCQDRGIGLLCYGALAGGLLTDHWLGHDQPSLQTDNRSLVKYGLITEEFGGWEALQTVLQALAGVAEGTPPELSALRWVLDRPAVAACIVGASHRDRTPGNSRLWSGDWSVSNWDPLAEVLGRHPGPGGPVYGLEREPGGPHKAILRTNLNEE